MLLLNCLHFIIGYFLYLRFAHLLAPGFYGVFRIREDRKIDSSYNSSENMEEYCFWTASCINTCDKSEIDFTAPRAPKPLFHISMILMSTCSFIWLVKSTHTLIMNHIWCNWWKHMGHFFYFWRYFFESRNAPIDNKISFMCICTS